MAAPMLPAGRAMCGIDPAEAVEILPPGIDKRVWRATRRTGLGGSDASALLGMTGYRAPIELWEDKTGRVPILDVPPSEEAEMGELLEPIVRDRFARVHGVEVRLAGMLRSSRWHWMYANPDALVDGPDGDVVGYEGKTCDKDLASQWGTDRNPLVPDHAELQAQWGMAVTGLAGWWVACLIGGQRNVYRYLHRDDELIGDLVAISGHWWATYVEGGTEPPADGTRAWTAYLKRKYRVAEADTELEISPEEKAEIAARRRAALEAEREARTTSEALKNWVRARLGDRARLVADGKTVVTYDHTKRFKHAEFAREEPALADEYRTSAPAIDVDRLAVEKPDVYRRYCTRQLNFKV